MSDWIDRQELLNKIKANRQAWLPHHKRLIIDSVESLIMAMPRHRGQTCNECMISKPLREFIPVRKATPKPLEEVLVKLESGRYTVAKFNNGSWLGWDNTIGWNSATLSNEYVTEWKVIDG